MITEMFALHDRVAGFYSQPFFCASVGVAKRTIQEVVSDMSTQVARHPGDFSLFHLGTFDNDTARFHAFAMPEFFCTALSLGHNVPSQMPLPLEEGVK